MVNAFFLLLKKTFPRGFQNLILIIKKKLCLHYLEFQSNQFAHGRRQGSNQILTYFPVEEPAVSVCHSLEERVPCPLSFQVKYPCKLFGIICLFSPINLFSLYQCGFLDVCLWILYQLSHRGSPRILEWVAYSFSRGSFPDPVIKPGSPALQVDSLPTQLSGKPLLRVKNRDKEALQKQQVDVLTDQGKPTPFKCQQTIFMLLFSR